MGIQGYSDFLNDIPIGATHFYSGNWCENYEKIISCSVGWVLLKNAMVQPGNSGDISLPTF